MSLLFLRRRVKTKTLHQYAETECGLVALAILFDYYRMPIDLQSLREKAGLSRDGCRATTLIALAKLAGFQAEAYALSIDEVRQLKEPVIAYWRFSHYVVIEQMMGDSVYINDPACGRHTITLDEMDKAFTGIVIHLTPQPNQTAPAVRPRPALWRSWLITGWREFSFIVVCLLLAGLLPLVMSGLNAAFVNQVLMQHHLNWLRWLLRLMAFFTLSYTVMQVANQWHQFKLATKLSYAAVSQVFLRALSWPIITYTLRPKSELLAVLSQIDAFISTGLSALSSLLAAALTVFVISICLFAMNAPLTGITVGLSFVCFLAVTIVGVFKKPLEMTAKQADIQWAAGSLSAFNHLETVALTGMQAQVQHQWSARLNEKLHKQSHVNAYTAVQAAITQFYQAIILPLTVLMGLKFVQSGELTLGALLAYASLSVLLNRQMVALMEALKSTQTAITEVDRGRDVANLPMDSRYSLPMTTSPHVTPPSIRVKQLTFYFNRTAQPVIDNVSFDIQPYQHIAFVGGTGSGKSTLASLLAGLYQPDSGDVFYNEQPTTACHPNELSALCAVVSQESPLFSGSILENLTSGREGLPMEAVHQVIQQTGLTEFISKRGLDLDITVGSANVSGGEKQRIDIARALLQNTPVLILDEATSALDVETEAALMRNLRELKKTIIFVAHRLSTIIHCDHIFVLHEGKMVESGTHATLMGKKGHYYALYQREGQSDV